MNISPLALILVSVLTLGFASLAQAGEPASMVTPETTCAAVPAEDDGPSCDGSTMEMHECIATALQIADKELNTIYSAIRTNLKKTYSEKREDVQSRKDASEIDRRLVAAQRAWITFRDAECSLQSTEMLGGTGERLVEHGCNLGKTKARVKDLKRYL